MTTWRVIDTGLRPAAQNIALNRALLEARQQDASPSTLRFLTFEPCALLGYHQSAVQELNLAYCRRMASPCNAALPAAGQSISMKPRSAGNCICTNAISAALT